MLGVWYPSDLLEPGLGIPWWVSVLALVAFVLGCAVTVWLYRGR